MPAPYDGQWVVHRIFSREVCVLLNIEEARGIAVEECGGTDGSTIEPINRILQEAFV